LRGIGIDARLDVWEEGSRQDWAVWAQKEIEEADFVIVVASSAYRLWADGGATPEQGRGVQFEAALLREKIFEDRAAWLRRVLPVVLPGGRVSDIPVFLQPRSASHYQVTSFTAAGASMLLRVMADQPAQKRPDLGPAGPRLRPTQVTLVSRIR
jgi:hypothetical protein